MAKIRILSLTLLLCFSAFPLFADNAVIAQSEVDMSWDEAINFCKEKGGRLPTVAEHKQMYKTECSGKNEAVRCGHFWWSSEKLSDGSPWFISFPSNIASNATVGVMHPISAAALCVSGSEPPTKQEQPRAGQRALDRQEFETASALYGPEEVKGDLLKAFPKTFKKVKVFTWIGKEPTYRYPEVREAILKTLADKGYEVSEAGRLSFPPLYGELAPDEACLVVLSDSSSVDVTSYHSHTRTREIGRVKSGDGDTIATIEEDYPEGHETSRTLTDVRIFLELRVGSGEKNQPVIYRHIIEERGKKPDLPKWTKKAMRGIPKRAR